MLRISLLLLGVVLASYTLTFAHHSDMDLSPKCAKYRQFLSEYGINDEKRIDDEWHSIERMLLTIKDNSEMAGKLVESPSSDNDQHRVVLSDQVDQIMAVTEEYFRLTMGTYVSAIKSLEKCVDGLSH